VPGSLAGEFLAEASDYYIPKKDSARRRKFVRTYAALYPAEYDLKNNKYSVKGITGTKKREK
jgi:hypothetical protein